MEIKSEIIELSAIKLNPDDPRTITEKDMDRLVKSIQNFPEMMKLREIVVDENNIILGGNMRLLALKKMGTKKCPVKIITGLSQEQKLEFIIKEIKDNTNYVGGGLEF